MADPRISLDQVELGSFCRRNRIRRLALFGSVLRDDFRPDSDVDVLVEFERGAAPAWISSRCRMSSPPSWAAAST